MSNIISLIQSKFPKIEEMPFLSAIQQGKFGRKEILNSEVVELYRALYTREKIQNIYKDKLKEAADKNIVSKDELGLMTEVIDDEGETEDHIDHLDMRFKLFNGTEIKRGYFPKFNDELQKINDEWMSICQESDLFTLMSCTAAIEGWYPDISTFFEKEYSKRGFNKDELEIFIAHQDADVHHSESQNNILLKNIDKIDIDVVDKMVTRTFNTSKAYDKMKLEFAEQENSVESYFEKR
tara:strand:- start:561 stop:1274 length:714 start_codon:yes stop_codon:yes gene_type:complete